MDTLAARIEKARKNREQRWQRTEERALTSYTCIAQAPISPTWPSEKLRHTKEKPRRKSTRCSAHVNDTQSNKETEVRQPNCSARPSVIGGGWTRYGQTAANFSFSSGGEYNPPETFLMKSPGSSATRSLGDNQLHGHQYLLLLNAFVAIVLSSVGCIPQQPLMMA